MSLAKFVVLKSNANNKYLCRFKENGDTRSSLRFSHEIKHPMGTESFEVEAKRNESLAKSENIGFHLLKFEVEEAKTAKGFVHIRTCYNNKYWVRSSAETKSIVAEAHEPEEDQSKWSCTLFKPVFLGEVDEETDLFIAPNAKKPQKIQLIHISDAHSLVGSDNNGLEVRTINPETTELESESTTALMSFTVFDVVPNIIIPPAFTVMGQDGKYMAAYGGNNLGFRTTDVGTTGVYMQTYIPPSPTYLPLLIKEPYRKWRINENNDVGLVDSYGTPSYFGPYKMDNYVVLYCKDNKNYVTRTANDGVSCRTPTITEGSKVRIGEPVTYRQIRTATYDLDGGRVYNTTSVQKYIDSIYNNTSQAQEGTFEVEYKTSATSSWKQSEEVQVGITATWSFGIPRLGEFGIEISASYSNNWEWGQEKTEESTVKITRHVIIPARKRVTLKVVATKAYCDVPFSCEVLDVMTDGSTRDYVKTDGLFVGCNEFNFHTIIDEDDA